MPIWMTALGLLCLEPAMAALPMPLPVPGTVTVTLGDAGAARTDQPFADAVAQALGSANFTTLPEPNHSRYVAVVSIVRKQAGVVTSRVAREPASAGIGSWGPAVRVPLGSRKTVLHDLVVTTLTVRLLERTGHAPVWSGAAVTAGAEGTAVAGKLARAAVASFPQTVATPVSVP